MLGLDGGWGEQSKEVEWQGLLTVIRDAWVVGLGMSGYSLCVTVTWFQQDAHALNPNTQILSSRAVDD